MSSGCARSACKERFAHALTRFPVPRLSPARTRDNDANTQAEHRHMTHDKQGQRQTERHAETDRQTETETETDRDRERQADRQRQIDRQTHTAVSGAAEPEQEPQRVQEVFDKLRAPTSLHRLPTRGSHGNCPERGELAGKMLLQDGATNPVCQNRWRVSLRQAMSSRRWQGDRPGRHTAPEILHHLHPLHPLPPLLHPHPQNSGAAAP